MKRCINVAVVGVGLMAAVTPALTQQVEGFVPFNNFIQSVAAADSAQYVGRPGNKVQDAAAFEEMRQHILTMYNGVHVSNSFVLDNDHVDCVPTEEQPAVRLGVVKAIATAPPASALSGPRSIAGSTNSSQPKSIELKSQFNPGQTSDKFGNSLGCSAGTIPMKRMTLEEMSHFANLRAFFEKGPNGFGQAVSGDGLKQSVDSTVHKHAVTLESVNNLGGQSYLNLWKPYVDNSVGQNFTLSQHWYVGGSGSSTQTAEVGWQNTGGYPTQESKLFIYYTPDNYNTGCYNLTCGKFVQVNNSWTLGGGFPNYSIYGTGWQYGFTAEYYLYQGNWWLAINGTWIGYYPTSIYQGGQMAYYAQKIEYGGEVDVQNSNDLYPAMGSGNWPSFGYEYAAYQSGISYLDTNSVSNAPSLTAYEEAPSCYLIDGTGLTNQSPYFYFGGPGGYGC